MNLSSPKSRRSLAPFAWLYHVGVNVRNALFDAKLLKQYKFDVPIICVGNITVGGTGKTPHIEYLVDLLEERYQIAVLSRGYKRKSKGFLEVETTATAEEVGDEPLQIKKKYPHVTVVVDKNRVRAIEKLTARNYNRPQVILLDDGFQHRRVIPSMSILLVDSTRPVYEDKMLPVGNLREPLSGKDRASIVLVTKCTEDMQPIDFRIYENGLELFPYQKLYFTSFEYGDVVPVFPELQTQKLEPEDLRKKHVFLVTGIAVPQPLAEMLELKTYNLYPKFYPDHHFFTEKEIEEIENEIDNLDVDEDEKIIVTTEKDATRLRSMPFLCEKTKKRLYYIPIRVIFLRNKEKESFNKKIIKHVRNNQTNSRFSERKNR